MLIAVAGIATQGVFTEDPALWLRIDRLNAELSRTDLSSEELEGLFMEAVELAVSPELSSQFEDLRSDAFSLDLWARADSFSLRASPGITAHILGESDNIGVNVVHFLMRSTPGTEAFRFFDLACSGFYVDGAEGRIGTAELPVWMESAGSSFQAATDTAVAGEMRKAWETGMAEFNGYFLEIALETVLGLGGEPPEDPGDDR
jgi:hypothetical protein